MTVFFVFIIANKNAFYFLLFSYLNMSMNFVCFALYALGFKLTAYGL
jgi:hypothetical protein